MVDGRRPSHYLSVASFSAPHRRAGPRAVAGDSDAFPEALQRLWRDVFTQWSPVHAVVPGERLPQQAGPEIRRARVAAGGSTAEAEPRIPVERVPG
ncbi:AraC family transcriptional regulator [Streptomyces sp. NPDC048001]|uniref:AraC family transcriptional regulator n=1 Tax=Streptomyces sp. NPDC048001 TaxID=3365498 RepID=UPI0037201784